MAIKIKNKRKLKELLASCSFKKKIYFRPDGVWSEAKTRGCNIPFIFYTEENFTSETFEAFLFEVTEELALKFLNWKKEQK